MTSELSLEGRVAVVTGGSRGIGRAVAVALAGAGARVCVTARDPGAVRETVAALTKSGAEATGLAGSVADPAHLWELTERALDAYGRLDILVNNAATNEPYGPLMEADPRPGARRSRSTWRRRCGWCSAPGGPGCRSTAGPW